MRCRPQGAPPDGFGATRDDDPPELVIEPLRVEGVGPSAGLPMPDGERMLYGAILLDGLAHDRAWVLATPEEHRPGPGLTFEDCCLALGLNPDAVRDRVQSPGWALTPLIAPHGQWVRPAPVAKIRRTVLGADGAQWQQSRVRCAYACGRCGCEVDAGTLMWSASSGRGRRRRCVACWEHSRGARVRGEPDVGPRRWRRQEAA